MPNPYDNLPAQRSTNSLVEIESRRNAAEIMIAVEAARRFPRDPRQAFERIITDFTRVELAEEAQYEYPRGGKTIRGLSIRAAEVIVRHWGNVRRGFRVLDRVDGENGKPGLSSVEAYAWDLETNAYEARGLTVLHQRDKEDGAKVLTSERDIYEHVANQAQRRVRACILAFIPSDIKDAVMLQCDKTLELNSPVTDETKRKLLAAFEPYGVTRKMIEARIQRNFDSISPTLYLQFKRIYASLKDEMSSPEDWFDLSIGKEVEGATRTEQIKNLLAQKLAPEFVPTDALGSGMTITTPQPSWTGTEPAPPGEALRQGEELMQQISTEEDAVVVLARAVQGAASLDEAYKVAEGALHLGLNIAALSMLIKDVTHHHELKPTTVKAVLAEIERRATA